MSEAKEHNAMCDIIKEINPFFFYYFIFFLLFSKISFNSLSHLGHGQTIHSSGSYFLLLLLLFLVETKHCFLFCSLVCSPVTSNCLRPNMSWSQFLIIRLCKFLLMIFFSFLQFQFEVAN